MMLDVSWVTADPNLSDVFDVVRQVETVGLNGRVVVTPTTFPGIVGVVTQQDPADIMRREDGQMVPRSIFVATSFAVRGAVAGNQPDRLIWSGTNYLVKQVMPYARNGLYEVVASSDTAMDVAQ